MKYVRLFFLGAALAGTQAAAAEMVQIEGGSYRPLYLKKDTGLIKVKPFKLDKYPVTNAEFAEFVNSHPQWQKGRIGSKQAEPAYLKHWMKNGSRSYAPKAGELKQPVTNVSWFAANAYCAAQGKRCRPLTNGNLPDLLPPRRKTAQTNPATTALFSIGMPTADGKACTMSAKAARTTGAFMICTG